MGVQPAADAFGKGGGGKAEPVEQQGGVAVVGYGVGQGGEQGGFQAALAGEQFENGAAGAAALLARKVGCAVINAGDGAHEHPTQALLDALTIRRHKGRLDGLTVAICGDILHSRVARSNIILLNTMGARVRAVGPSTLMPAGIAEMGTEHHVRLEDGIRDADVVMMLRLQRERMAGGFVPSVREYFRHYGLDAAKLAHARPDCLVMHPGPMNRGVEIDGLIADDINVSVIQEQVEMGVAVRMAVMEALLDPRRNEAVAP